MVYNKLHFVCSLLSVVWKGSAQTYRIKGLGRDLEPTTYNNFKHQKPTVKFDIEDVCPGELFKGSMTVTGAGGLGSTIPVDVVLAIDKSGSMGNAPPGGTLKKIVQAKDAALAFIERMAIEPSVSGMAGVVGWASSAVIYSYLTSPPNNQTVKDSIDNLNTGGTTKIDRGLEKAIEVHQNSPRPASDPVFKAILFLTDGENSPYIPCNELGSQAGIARDLGITIYSIGYNLPQDSGVAKIIKDMATCTGGRPCPVYENKTVEDAFDDIHEKIHISTVPHNISVILVPSNVIEDLQFEPNDHVSPSSPHTLENIDDGNGLPTGNNISFDFHGKIAENATPSVLVQLGTDESPISVMTCMDNNGTGFDSHLLADAGNLVLGSDCGDHPHHGIPTVKFDIPEVCPGEPFDGIMTVHGFGKDDDIHDNIQVSTVPHNISVSLVPLNEIEDLQFEPNAHVSPSSPRKLENIDDGNGLSTGNDISFDFRGKIAENAAPSALVQLGTDESPISVMTCMDDDGTGFGSHPLTDDGKLTLSSDCGHSHHAIPTVKFDIPDICPGEPFEGMMTVYGGGGEPSGPIPQPHSSISDRDIAAVFSIDTSNSMCDKRASGMSKLAAAKHTAISFIKSLVDTSTSNLAGAVGFHQWAYPFLGLTPNSQVLLDMIRDLNCLGGTEYTDLNKGLAGAIKVHGASSSPAFKAIIFLSDGGPKDDSYTFCKEAGSEAANARDQGIVIYSIGIGTKSNSAAEARLMDMSECTNGMFRRISRNRRGSLKQSDQLDIEDAILDAVTTRASSRSAAGSAPYNVSIELVPAPKLKNFMFVQDSHISATSDCVLENIVDGNGFPNGAIYSCKFQGKFKRNTKPNFLVKLGSEELPISEIACKDKDATKIDHHSLTDAGILKIANDCGKKPTPCSCTCPTHSPSKLSQSHKTSKSSKSSSKKSSKDSNPLLVWDRFRSGCVCDCSARASNLLRSASISGATSSHSIKTLSRLFLQMMTLILVPRILRM